MNGRNAATRPFFTIGHSTRSIEDLVALLQSAGADLIVDVRKMPRSRTNPQFNADNMSDALRPWQIGYRHIAALGGLRGRQDSPKVSLNVAWQNKSFRNYADYALTPAFKMGLSELRELGGTHNCAIMCAEAVWWRCHRRIIADYLIAGGATVLHILGPNAIKPAVLMPVARTTPEGLIYDG